MALEHEGAGGMTMMPDWVHYEADQMVTDDLEWSKQVHRALEVGAVRAKTDKYTLQASNPHRSGSARLAYQMWEPKLREMQDRVNEMLARMTVFAQQAAFAVEGEYRDVLDVSRKARSVTARDTEERIGQHAAWLQDLNCNERKN
jgi:hypothetical protein